MCGYLEVGKPQHVGRLLVFWFILKHYSLKFLILLKQPSAQYSPSTFLPVKEDSGNSTQLIT